MKIFLKILFLLFASYSFAQPITWMRYYDPSGSRDFGIDVIQTYDGGYMFVANTSGIALVKTNYLGVIEWQRIIPLGSASAIIQTSDSGYVIPGERNSRMQLLKVNKYGDTLWTKSYTRNGRNSRSWTGKMTRDNGFIICGDISAPFQTYVVKTDSLGNMQWDQLYNGTGALDITQSSNEYYYMTGSQPLRKLDSLGNEVWSLPIAGNKILQSASGHIYVGGGFVQFYIAKFDTSGKIIFQRNYFSQALCRGMCVDHRGNIILSGEIFTDTGTVKENIDVLLAKFDTSGVLQKSKVISLGKTSGGFVTQDGIASIKPTLDYGYIMCGTTDYPTGNDLFDNVLAIKTDSLFYTLPITSINADFDFLPKEFILHQNFPNPFNPSTKINFELKKSANIEIIMYDIKGRELEILINKKGSEGKYEIQFNSRNLPSGIYFYSLKVNGNTIDTKKLIIMK